jgi:predicted ATPase
MGTADLRVNCLFYAAHNLWFLGYPAQSLKRSQEAVALAEELSHPFSLAYALGNAALIHLLRREEQLARERAEVVMSLATDQGFPYALAIGTMVRGEALTHQGQVEEGIAQMQQGLAAYRAMGTELRLTWALALLAEAYGKGGQVEEGLSVLAEALATVDSTGERFYEAELYRLKGELTLNQSSVQRLVSSVEHPHSARPLRRGAFRLPPPSGGNPQLEAEACFLKAIEIAQKQQAKSLELRAVMSLSRLWQQQGKQREAHGMLADVYGWFTEGFDTKDLQEAKALLAELSEGQ